MGILQSRILEWVAMPDLLQGIFPTQGLILGLPHCRQILYCLSHQVISKSLTSRRREGRKHCLCYQVFQFLKSAGSLDTMGINRRECWKHSVPFIYDICSRMIAQLPARMQVCLDPNQKRYVLRNARQIHSIQAEYRVSEI